MIYLQRTASYIKVTLKKGLVMKRLKACCISFECHGFSVHCQLDCLFNKLSRKTRKKISKPHITGQFQSNVTEDNHLWEKMIINHKKIYRYIFSWNGGFMSLLYHHWDWRLSKLHISVSPVTINTLTPCDSAVSVEIWFSNSLQRIVPWSFGVKCSQMNASEPHWWEVNIGSGNGSMHLGS